MERAPNAVEVATDPLVDAAYGFINRLHRPGELFCIVVKNGPRMDHKWFRDARAAAAYALQETDKGHDVYISCASFTEERRRGECVDRVCGLYVDLDCGPGKPYPTKREALQALTLTCKKLTLPLPDVWVDSGNGLHLYWLREGGIPYAEWKPIAEMFKATLIGAGLQIDPSVTADGARILRVPGTKNYKNTEGK